MTHLDSYPDSWSGLASPQRGSAITRRELPAVVRSRDLARLPTSLKTAHGPLEPLRRGVLAPRLDPLAPADTRAITQVLRHARAFERTAGTPFAFSRTTAAVLLGGCVLRPGLPVHVTQATRSSSPAAARAVVVRHVQELPERDLRTHDDVVVTSIERTLVDCALTLPFVAGVALADSALRLGADRDVVEVILAELFGARGVRNARDVVAAATSEVHSPAESIIRAVAIQAGLPVPATLHMVSTDIGQQELDIAWPKLKVAVEMDGAIKFAGLSGAALVAAMHEAMARDRAIARAGWIVLRLDWAALRNPALLARRLERLIRFGLV